MLLGDVDGTHVNLAFQPEQRGCGGQCDAVLTRTGLGDDGRLAHAFGEQGLSEAVVDLVGAGVVEVLTLEDDPCPTELLGESVGEGEG